MAHQGELARLWKDGKHTGQITTRWVTPDQNTLSI